MLRIVLLALAVFTFRPLPACLAETVTIPMTMDYPMVQALMIRSFFQEPGQSAVVLDEDEGCRRVVVSRPRVSENDGYLRLQVWISVHAGVSMFGKCRMPVQWEGYLVLDQSPCMDPQSWTVRFETQHSTLYGPDRRPADLAGIVWELIKGKVFSFLENITIDLSMPHESTRDFLVASFPKDMATQALGMVESMRLHSVTPDSRGLRIQAVMDIPQGLEKEESGEKTLSEKDAQKQLELLAEAWEEWDSFLVYVITALAEKPLSTADRDTLLDVLLTSRYRFVAALDDPPAATKGNDFVRELFVDAWKQMGPVFKNHLGTSPSDSILGYLSLFSASDALTALDAAGPGLNIDISRQGLVRLAGTLTEGRPLLLSYRYGVDSDLRRTLGLSADEPRKSLSPDLSGSFLKNLAAILGVKTAYADSGPGAPPPGALESARQWLFVKPHVREHLDRILPLLEETSREILVKGTLPPQYHDLYYRLVKAVAWQESCFRQFVIKNDSLTYIRSYNDTSVGIMQINERVWRGIYDQQSLQWDIAYNARAGCEIVALYFKKYILRRMHRMDPVPQWEDKTFAGLLYAMYNGGPSQFFKYLKRLEKKDFAVLKRTLRMQHRLLQKSAQRLPMTLDFVK